MAAPCGKQLKAFLYGEAVDKIIALFSSSYLFLISLISRP
jgi:hypothetical protein